MVELKELQRHWNGMGELDPLFAILTRPGKKGNRWERQEFLETGRGAVQVIIDWIRNASICLSYGRALDFGCGAGRLTQALCEHFHLVDGIDIAPSMLAQANEWNSYPDRCTYRLNEQADLRVFPDATFDFVCTLITLQHMRPEFSSAYIAEFCRVLAPGGVLVFQVPDSMNSPALMPKRNRLFSTPHFLRKIKRWLERRREKPGLIRGKTEDFWMEMYCLPEQEVRCVLRQCGMQIVSVVQDHSAGKHFVSKRYLAQRPVNGHIPDQMAGPVL